MSERTCECYTRSVRQLVEFYDQTPDKISEIQLQDYFLHRKNKNNWSAATLRICYSGIKFFFVNVLKRDWHTLSMVHAKREKRLPSVLSVDEIRLLLDSVTTPQNKAYLTTVYSCGLRLNEALHLQVKDIDAARMSIDVHRGIHYIVPGGAFSKKEGLWHSSRQDYFLPEKALAKIYKAKFLHQMKKAGLLKRIPYEARKIDWKVNCQPIGTGFESVKYLAPYVFKVAISNARIVKVEDRIVSFRYKKVKSNRWCTCQLSAMEFIRRFLQHVLPTGFMKVRYYGFLHPSSSGNLETIKISIEASTGANAVAIQVTISKYIPSCPDCGGQLEYLYSVLPYMIPPRESG